jgi:hypothetical protein
MWNIDEVEVLCHVLCVNIGRELHPEVLCLYDNPLGPDGMEALLVPLTGQDEHLPLNKSLQSLSIGGAESRMGQKGAKAIARMLCTNTTLKDLRVGCEPSLTPSDVCDFGVFGDSK